MVAALLTSRRSLIAVAAVAAAIELFAAAGNVRNVVRAGREAFAERSDRVRDADLDPLASYASTGALVLARQAIPPGATYAVVVGKAAHVEDPGATRAAFRFYLQPRRYTTRLADAQWIVTYHASSESLGLRYTREIGLGPDANLVQVAR